MRRPIPVQVNDVFGYLRNGRDSSGFSGPGIDIKSGETAAVYHRAEAMPALEQVAGSPQVDRQFVHLAGLEQGRLVIGCAVASSRNSVADEHRPAVREHVRQ